MSLDPDTGIPRGIIVLQYNPDTLTRTLQPQAVGDAAGPLEILRLKGPPIETISVAAEIDATDQLAAPADTAGTAPRHPAAARGAGAAGLSVERRPDRSTRC